MLGSNVLELLELELGLAVAVGFVVERELGRILGGLGWHVERYRGERQRSAVRHLEHRATSVLVQETKVARQCTGALAVSCQRALNVGENVAQMGVLKLGQLRQCAVVVGPREGRVAERRVARKHLVQRLPATERNVVVVEQ